MESIIKIKICGLTKPAEIKYLNHPEIAYAGFVLDEKSKRFVTLNQAGKLKRSLQKRIKAVAVTVSPDLELLKRIEEAGFDIIQVHQELSEQILNEARIPIWQAVNICTPENIAFQQHEKIIGYVVDGAKAGSGVPFDWEKGKQIRACLPEKQMILAGGLHADNIKKGIELFCPDVVDVSSGVEVSEGNPSHGKSEKKIAEFVRKVRSNG